MARLATRLEQLEKSSGPPSLRPVLLIGPGDDEVEALVEWQAQYGPCDAEPFFVHLVGL
ncbi:MAG: hypothetical protein KKE77_12770 [Alphaproteobacteria bacterium]|nr:hypothetical protein [Alphaproteobacteria bacterium]